MTSTAQYNYLCKTFSESSRRRARQSEVRLLFPEHFYTARIPYPQDWQAIEALCLQYQERFGDQHAHRYRLEFLVELVPLLPTVVQQDIETVLWPAKLKTLAQIREIEAPLIYTCGYTSLKGTYGDLKMFNHVRMRQIVQTALSLHTQWLKDDFEWVEPGLSRAEDLVRRDQFRRQEMEKEMGLAAGITHHAANALKPQSEGWLI